ncbi:hypothetical protein BJ508DRAFT_329492 [Ascobolus immersus RN42]|uniref:Uncharacterized protein n=1 Tax=Ascobolus immersus RN42 TaxID=1160509 RepID=A0A3N4HWI0_ASCIM|nr:hypothetical protein BJ508DRAFT_329492 [Ascobolus immersus RN42]
MAPIPKGPKFGGGSSSSRNSGNNAPVNTPVAAVATTPKPPPPKPDPPAPAKVDPAKPDAPKPKDTKSGDSKGGDSKGGDSKAGKKGESKGSKSGDSKGAKSGKGNSGGGGKGSGFTKVGKLNIPKSREISGLADKFGFSYGKMVAIIAGVSIGLAFLIAIVIGVWLYKRHKKNKKKRKLKERGFEQADGPYRPLADEKTYPESHAPDMVSNQGFQMRIHDGNHGNQNSYMYGGGNTQAQPSPNGHLGTGANDYYKQHVPPVLGADGYPAKQEDSEIFGLSNWRPQNPPGPSPESFSNRN